MKQLKLYFPYLASTWMIAWLAMCIHNNTDKTLIINTTQGETEVIVAVVAQAHDVCYVAGILLALSNGRQRERERDDDKVRGHTGSLRCLAFLIILSQLIYLGDKDQTERAKVIFVFIILVTF
ncbi:hypothetical protein ACJX0J_018877, partial [Zea mays]